MRWFILSGTWVRARFARAAKGMGARLSTPSPAPERAGPHPRSPRPVRPLTAIPGAMKVHQTFTFIVSRNFGHPITWNVQAWRVYVGGALAAALLLGMTALSSLYLLTFSHVRDLERERQELELERDALRDEMHSQSQSNFETKDKAWSGAIVAESSARSDRPTPAALDESLYTPPFRIDSFAARTAGNSLEAAFRIVSQGDPTKNGGGFLFVIFENLTETPPRYMASPTVDVNEEGFPQLYKSGIRFSRVRSAQTYRRTVNMQAAGERFTHVTVYLFSLRGGLLAKERYPLDPGLFTASL